MPRHVIPVKMGWLERAVQTYNYHRIKVNAKEDWTLIDTADALGRSLGSVSEDVTIASWLKTHEKQIKSFKYAKDALEFIRNRKKRMMTEPVSLD